MKQKTFYEEIGQIQNRHSIFFPDSQMQFIKVKKSGDSITLNIWTAMRYRILSQWR